MRLTKRTVDATQPGNKDVIIWDAELRGFGLRIKPSGAKIFLVQYRDESRRTRRLSIGRYGVLTVEQARALKRMAELVDVGQERGKIAKPGGDGSNQHRANVISPDISIPEPTTLTELGIS